MPGRLLDWVIVRIVSLLPSATEIVYGLGLGDQLAGVTFECDEPASARTDKTVVVGGRDTSGMTPAAIDAYVRAQLAAGEDLYTLHADALAALAPDLILTQDLCRVCALPAGHVEDALDYLGCTAEVVSLDPHRLDDVLATIRTVGQHAGAEPEAERLVAELRRRLAAVADRVAGRRRPPVAVIEWTTPPFTAGHWVPTWSRRPAAAPSRPVLVAVPSRPPGSRSRRRGRRWSWWPPAASTSTTPPPRPSWSPASCRGCRCGRSTPTAWSSAPVPAWSTASRRSQPSSTPTPESPRPAGRIRRIA